MSVWRWIAVGVIAAIPALTRAETPTQTAAEAELAKTIQAGFDALNAGDTKAYEALYDSPAVVIDDSTPYVWSGPHAAKAWEKAQDAWARANGVTAMTCKLNQTIRNEVVGNRGYFVGSGDCTVLMHGVTNVQSGTWTFTMVRKAHRWRCSALAFGGAALKPVRN